ncbi:hypothetical protein [Streptomyces sp. NPDC002952]|uniref:hypothetical protein n=1 Tax=Streptomyces sp. NPDC002952 TaxID=3364673 RepID=UPI003694B2D9
MNPASPSPEDRAPTHPLTAAERAEYERLRRHAGVRHRPVRRAGASVLPLLTLLLAPLAVVAAWVQDLVTDTDRYVQTVAPPASEPAVQKVVTDRLSDRVVSDVDVKAVTDSLAKALQDAGAQPRVVDGAEALTGPLRSAFTEVVDRTVSRVITSNVFQQAWEGVNRRAHDTVVGMLTGDRSGVVSAEGDTVRLDVGEVRQRLVDAGFGKAAAIPDTDRTITLFETEKLSKAQDTMRLLDVVGTWVPVVTLVLAALAVWTTPYHRLMMLTKWVSAGLIAAGALALLRWNHPSVGAVALIVCLVLAALILAAVLAAAAGPTAGEKHRPAAT